MFAIHSFPTATGGCYIPISDSLPHNSTGQVSS